MKNIFFVFFAYFAVYFHLRDKYLKRKREAKAKEESEPAQPEPKDSGKV
jgi:hypothetical protein